MSNLFEWCCYRVRGCYSDGGFSGGEGDTQSGGPSGGEYNAWGGYNGGSIIKGSGSAGSYFTRDVNLNLPTMHKIMALPLVVDMAMAI